MEVWGRGLWGYGWVLDQLRAATAKGAGVSGIQACPITACQMILGPEGDPLWTATTPSVRWWVGVWSGRVC